MYMGAALWIGAGMMCAYTNEGNPMFFIAAFVCFVIAGVCHMLMRCKVDDLEREVEDLKREHFKMWESQTKINDFDAFMFDEIRKKLEDDGK